MKQTFLRVLIPVLGLVGLAMVVQGVSAQETPADEGARGRVVARAPSMFSFSTSSGTYLGVFIREVTADDAERLALSEERGALITNVPDEGPASEAGFQADDVVVSWNGTRIESAAQLRRMVGETPAGRGVDIGFIRDGRERTVSVELADRSPGVASFMPQMEEIRHRLEQQRERDGELHERLGELREFRFAPSPGSGNFQFFMRGGRLGVGIQNLGDQLAGYFGADEGGVLVTSVSEDSPAAAAGLRAGDVIIGIDGGSVEGPGDLMKKIAEADEGEIEIRILRDRRERTQRVTLPERNERLRSGNAFFFGPQAMGFEFPFGGDSSVLDWNEFVLDWNGGELMNIRIPELHFEFEMPDIEMPDLDIDFQPHVATEHGVQT